MKKLLFGILACCLFSLPIVADDESTLRTDHPDVYTVVEGDTLWDIANRFLRDPWMWPEIWKLNDQIKNPHLIYPGDQVALVYVDGQPRLTVNRGGAVRMGPRDVKLSPTMRSQRLEDAIPAIPLEDINAFLSRNRIIDERIMEKAPYVLAGAGGHVIAGAGDRVYARGSFPRGERFFGIFRGGQTFVDPGTGEVLGFEAVHIGRGNLVEVEGDIGTLAINGSNEEVRSNDRLLPYVEQRIAATFFPSAPESDVNGVILAVEGGVTQVSQMNIVAINRGARDGIADGNILAIDRAGPTVKDPVTRKGVNLPDTRAGLLMIFRTFERMSYGLVLSSSQSLKVMDRVHRP